METIDRNTDVKTTTVQKVRYPEGNPLQTIRCGNGGVGTYPSVRIQGLVGCLDTLSLESQKTRTPEERLTSGSSRENSTFDVGTPWSWTSVKGGNLPDSTKGPRQPLDFPSSDDLP